MNRYNCGVLLVQMGTPEAPTPGAVKRFLREFLMDPRIVDIPPVVWRPLLELAILPLYGPRSAAKYKSIWGAGSGAPLLHNTQLQAQRLGELLPRDFRVWIAMRYGRPSLIDGIGALRNEGVSNLLVFPMYPQYSRATHESLKDALEPALRVQGTRFPSVRVVPPFYNHPAYIRAVCDGISREITKEFTPDRIVLSFHSLPMRAVQNGDPYPDQCRQTFEQVREALSYPDDQVMMTYQSRMGFQDWLEPDTLDVLGQLGRIGVKRVLAATPGFPADCLETMEEIGMRGSTAFLEAGGMEFRRTPCLNDQPVWIHAMRTMILEQVEEWKRGGGYVQ